MANPNLLGISTVTGSSTAVSLATTGYYTVLSNAASSGRAYKVISLMASHSNNNTANVSVNVRLNAAAAGAGSSTVIIKDVALSSGAAQVIIDKNNPLYLVENKSLVASASSINAVDVTVTYEELY